MSLTSSWGQFWIINKQKVWNYIRRRGTLSSCSFCPFPPGPVEKKIHKNATNVICILSSIWRREILSSCCLFPPVHQLFSTVHFSQLLLFPPVYQLLHPQLLSTVHSIPQNALLLCCSVAACLLSKVGLNSFRVHKHLLGFLNATITIFSPPAAWPPSPSSSLP